MTTGAERKATPEEGRARRNTVINVRASRQTRDLIERAAEVSGKTITNFVLDSATQRAMDVLLDQRFFTLSNDQYQAFLSILDNPPPPGEKLKQLMRRKAPWEV